MCFFDGRAGFNQTRELATVALDTNLPIDVREAAADRVLTSPYSGTGDMTIPSEIRAAVPSDDPVLISLAARLDERDRLQRERMHRIRTTPAIPAPRAPTHTSGGPSNGAQFTFKIADVEYGVPAANASSALAQAHALAESEGVTVTVSSAQDTLAVCKPTHTSGGPSNGAQFL
jgi:hypothetical protein